MKIVDANFILRYLLNDIEEQANEAFSILKNSPVCLLNEVIAEIVYVLEKVYKVERNRICTELKDLIESDNIQVDNIDVMNCALETFSKSRLDFIDSLLCAYVKVTNATICTFDKKLLNAIKVK
ncbi:MAG TPA: PIN domain-containing protein [Clostridia bacterium]